MHRPELGERDDIGMLLDLASQLRVRLGPRRLAQEQSLGVRTHSDGRRDQNETHRYRGERVGNLASGEDAGGQPCSGNHHTRDRGAVLQEHNARRRVAYLTHEPPERRTRLPCTLPQVAGRADQRDALGGERQGEHDERSCRISESPAAVQCGDPLADREERSREEDPDSGDERPEESLLAVPELVLVIRGTSAQSKRGEQDELVDRVGRRIAASASIAADPLASPASSFATAMTALAASATRIVSLLSSRLERRG
jgi:hypothetical protein